MRSLSVLMLILTLWLSGCSLYTPGVSARVGDGEGVRVDVGGGYYDDHHEGGGRFCPPGQAKKGNC